MAACFFLFTSLFVSRTDTEAAVAAHLNQHAYGCEAALAYYAVPVARNAKRPKAAKGALQCPWEHCSEAHHSFPNPAQLARHLRQHGVGIMPYLGVSPIYFVFLF